MALNIGKILSAKEKTYGCFDTDIGRLCLFCISSNNQSDLRKDIGGSIEKCDPEKYVRNFVVYTCFPEDQLKEDQYKPDEPILTIEDSNKLSIQDLEHIAKLYIEGTEYLYKKSEIIKDKKDNGENISRLAYTDIQHPKEDDETYIKYLHRLCILDRKRLKETMEKALRPIIDFEKIFSPTSFESIKNTFLMGDSLNRTIEALKPPQQYHETHYEERIPTTNYAENGRLSGENRLSPFREISDRLDELIDLSKRSTDYAIQSNETQIEIAGEIKSSGDAANKHSDENIGLTKKNISLTKFVIMVSVLGFFITGMSIYLSYLSSNKQEVVYKEGIDLIVSSISTLDTNSVNQSKSTQDSFDKLATAIQDMNNNSQSMTKLIDQNARVIEKLEKEKEADKKQIKNLNDKILELEKKFLKKERIN